MTFGKTTCIIATSDKQFVGLFEPDGTEIWIAKAPSLQIVVETGPDVYVPPGKREAHTWARFSYEIPSNSIVKEAFISVWNDVEGTHYGPFGAPIDPGFSATTGAWFSLTTRHEYLKGKRVFSGEINNWSHNWGRHVQLTVKYELAAQVDPPSN